MTLIGRWIPLNNDGVIHQSSNSVLTVRVKFIASIHHISLIAEFSTVITPLLAVFKLVLFMIVPRDLQVHYYPLYDIQKVHFIITLVSRVITTV